MDRKKIDSALAVALMSSAPAGKDRFSVFIEMADPVAGPEQLFLKELGILNARPGATIVTATLSKDSIAALSDQPWISRIRLARKMKFAGRS
ncbi:MAG: hypothetical protein LUO98_06425 [Methanoregula sp.]|nr:hypothetical protein [Methanoregula sp.]